MKASTTRNKEKKLYFLYTLLLLFLWHIASVQIGQEFLLVSPIVVLKRLFLLSFEKSFWFSIGGSFMHILVGFLLSFILGIALGILSYLNLHIKCLISPIVSVIKATPVVSFIILALVFLTTSKLPVFISFLMVFPIVWTNTLKGLNSANKELLEMSEVFKVPLKNQLMHIYFPTVLPYISSAASVGIGYAWKSGIAAEVIGLTRNSIGAALYDAKLYLATADMLCYTLVIVLISILSEKLIKYCMRVLSSFIMNSEVQV